MMKPIFEIQSDERNFPEFARIMSSSEPWITLKKSYDDCLKSLSGVAKSVVAIKVDEKIAGVIVIQDAGSFRGYLQSICISAEYRGAGIGDEALRFCESHISAYSKNFFLCVSTFNSGAIKFYEKHGFKIVGKLDNFVLEGFDEYLMRKTL